MQSVRTPSARSALHGRVADRVRRQPRHVVALEAEVREADGDVGLAAAERRRRARGDWKKPLESGRAEPQHDLAEGHDLRHQS